MAFTVFDADAAGPDGSIGSAGRHAPPPGTRPGGARGVVPAIAAIVILTVAVAIGGFTEAPAPSASPPPSEGEAIATAPVCVPASTTTVPAFSLGVAGGSGEGIGGLVGTTRLPGGVTPGVDWPVPEFEPGREVPVVASGTALEARALDASCFRLLVSHYTDAAAARTREPDLRQLRRGAVDPPSANPELGVLPDGDWVVRVQAYFETGLSEPAGAVVGERYFRVRVGSAPFPTRAPSPGPQVTPAVACGPAPATPDEVELTLTAPGGEPVMGVADGTDASMVTIPLGENGTLAVVGDACARSWDVGVFDAQTGRAFRSDVVGNPTDDPDHVAQNRWNVWATVGDFFLVANLHFGPGIDVMKVWRIAGPNFTVPETVLIAADGRRIAARPGCGLTYQLPNGYSVTDACDQFRLPDGVRLLRVPAWSRLVLEVPGWTITIWDGACGRVGDRFEGFEVFTEADYCPLGGYSVPDGASPPGPVQFLARPGEWAVRLHVRAERGGTFFDGQVYALVTGE
jgi:hypothetical protein